ncbi:MAG: chromosome segregation protein SMC [Synergistaceae bacterium]|nr:chromosome segregation protein SMC [Candidatus Equadaptatus faecalis]
MYIGRLQLRGFKSFGGAHDLILPPGLTAIVGPNGSGKSNLLDALRWSLGDSSAARLRITRQSDLLFQGSASLGKAKEGEVVLQFRDEDGTSIVKRRVTAPDGATSLFIDGAKCNLSDLEEMKTRWKLDGDRFAFIGQGEVAEAIQERPAERRKRLEALFGTEIYRKKRMNAADRLVTVKEEYDQIRNLMSELETRREEIKPEVDKARKLKEIMDSIEDDRRMLYWMRRASSEAELAGIADANSQAERIKAELNAWIERWKNLCAAKEKQLEEIARSQKEQTWELEQCRNRFESLTKSGVASASSLRSAKGRLVQAKEDLEKAKQHLDELLADQEKNQKENQKASAALQKSQKALEAVEKKWTEFNAKLEEQKSEREELNNERGNLEAELEKLKAKLNFLGREVLEFKNKKSEEKDQRKDIDKEIRKNEAQRDALLEEQEELVKKHGVLYARVQQLASDLQQARRTASQARSKLNEVMDALQGDIYPRPVQFLLSAAKLNRLNAVPRAVIDVFSCENSLSTAFEAFLGAKQFHLLVENIEEAGRCIDKLKQNNGGRVTCLPLERCKPRFPNMDFAMPVRGVVGWAMDLIQVEDHWLPAIQHIMGDLLVVEDFDTGKQLVREGFRGPVVSLEGDVFQPGGTVSGGKRTDSGRAIKLKAQLSVLEKEAADASRMSEELGREYKKQEAEEMKVSEQNEEYTRKIREFDGKIALLADRRESYAKEQKRMEGEKARILESIKSEGQHWQEILTAMEEVERRWDEQGEVDDDRKLIEEREKLRSEVAVAAERASARFALIERINNEIRSEEGKIGTLDEELSELDYRCLQDKAALSQIGKECLNIHNRRQELLAEINRRVGGYSKLEENHKYCTVRIQNAELRMRAAMDKYASVEAKREALQKEIEEMISSWEEKYPYPGSEVLPDDVNLEELRRKIRDGDRKIKQYGDVNMGVLSEDDNLQQRLGFMGEHMSDVKKSADELNRLITEADNKAQQIFTDALQQVDDKFCSIFRTLFGGGEAHLEMTDAPTIWETGVDVIARPPGKHPLGIAQLSGGEKSLAAIALLFASMEVANCPMAVLDEVDAALDEVNLRRLSNLVKEYAQRRQILCMTHRRITMERADVLYGVTLQEPGLSQVVGVRMEDWA